MSAPQSSPGNPEQAAARFWNQRHQDPTAEAHDNFLAHPFIQTYVSLRAFGSPVGHLDAAIHAIRDRTRPGARVLSIGCGPAVKERALAEALPDRQFLGVDIAEEVVEIARQDIAMAGIQNLELRVGDFNRLQDLQLEDGLDILLGLGAIHHVENLEGLWAAARRWLRPGGVVMAQEYIGPNRFQWTDAQIDVGNAALDQLVPAEHKTHHSRVERVPLETIVALDPSEAVRSQEILASAEAAGLTAEGWAGAGGALLQPVLMHQIDSFDPQNWGHNLVLARLFAEEDRLMREGVLADDFAMFVLRP